MTTKSMHGRVKMTIIASSSVTVKLTPEEVERFKRWYKDNFYQRGLDGYAGYMNTKYPWLSDGLIEETFERLNTIFPYFQPKMEWTK